MVLYRQRKTVRAVWSSRSHQWYTPPDRLREWEDFLGGPFELDPCADPRSPIWDLIPRHFTVEDDGLAQPWNGRVFCNPPYGRAIGDWTRKAALETGPSTSVVLLVPARTDTAWWHAAIAAGAHPYYLPGRIRFCRPDGSTGAGAAFPSALLVFRNADAVTKGAP